MKKFQILIISVLTLFVLSPLAQAKDENSNPLGCRNLGYEFNMRLLHLKPGEAGKRNSMYFIHNILGQNLIIYQLHKGDTTISTFLNHIIRPNQWAVLSVNEKSMKFACSLKRTGKQYGELVDCAKVMKVCEFNNVKFGINNRGNYWIVGSSTRNGALNAVVHYGIIPAQ